MNNFKHTIAASYIGYITQAIVNNFAPLLFVMFNKSFGISMEKIALLITVNFCTQLVLDVLCSKFVGIIGYRRAVSGAHFMAFSGLVLMAFLPDLFGYAGLVIATMCYAVGGGVIEVVVSPIVEACPTDKKSASMSLLHSFYCWGQMLTVLMSTLFFVFFGIENWRILSILWAIVPFFNAFYFMKVPINRLEGDKRGNSGYAFLKKGMFWVFLLLMLCSGASELAMSQWASAFAEKGLGVSKSAGDILGMCMFAVLMGVSRVLYAKLSERVSIVRFMLGSALLCVLTYLGASLFNNPVLSLISCGICGFSVGIMWPGTYSLASENMNGAGVSMFALLALAGDLGCSAGPTSVGFISSALGDNLKTGLMFAVVFPLLMIVGIALLLKLRKKYQKN